MSLDINWYWHQLSLPIHHNISLLLLGWTLSLAVQCNHLIRLPNPTKSVAAVVGKINHSCCLHLASCCPMLVAQQLLPNTKKSSARFVAVVGKINNSCCLHLASCPLPAALSLLQPARRPFLALPLITVALSLSFPLYLDLYLSVFVFVIVFVFVFVFVFFYSTTFPPSLHNGPNLSPPYLCPPYLFPVGHV